MKTQEITEASFFFDKNFPANTKIKVITPIDPRKSYGPIHLCFGGKMFKTSNKSTTDRSSLRRWYFFLLITSLLIPADVYFAHRSKALSSAVYATVETTPTVHSGDSADDSSIWIHPTNPSLSTIIGTDKNGNLEVYDLSGTVLQRIPFNTNNVDLRYNFPLGGQRVALVTGVDRTARKLFAYKVNPATRLLEDVSTPSAISGLWGSSMYVSPITGRYYAFTNRDCVLNQYELMDNGVGKVAVNLVRTVTFSNQCNSSIRLSEGVTADDVHAKVYVSEEAIGIWKLGAEPTDGSAKVMVDKPIAQGGYFQPDIEGLTIYYKSNGTGYLIGSSQGNSSFNVYTREGNNTYLGTFNIADGAIDGVNGTDGIEVTNFPLGPNFPYGVFIAQDGGNTDGNVARNHNFKLVPFQSIAGALGLTIDTSWDPRLVGGTNTPPSSVTISGNVDAAGVTLSYTDGVAKTVTSAGNGTYGLSVPYNWNGTVALSHPCFTFNPTSRSYSNITASQSDQNYSATFNTAAGCANINVLIAGVNEGWLGIPNGRSIRTRFAGVDNGPVKVDSNNGINILAALRVIWNEPGARTSYSEMMGLPTEQLSTEYWFPWYNNAVPASMDQGFRIANVNASSVAIEILVGSTLLDGFTLNPNASVRVGYDIDNGPIRIVCTDCTGSEKIIAAMRVIWQEPGKRFSYSEMMGLPKEQLSDEYWFPWYNNSMPSSMDQGFRIANVSTSEINTVEVWVGSTQLDTLSLNPGASVRVGYNVDNGPIHVLCTTCTNMDTDKIIAALRVIWKEPGFRASYSEMMGLPTEQLSTEYWFPWFNNAVPTSMDQGFRIANVSPNEANTIEVWVGNTQLSAISLAAGASVRVGYNVDNGPIRIVCTTCTNVNYDQIIAALRVIWKELGYRSSYSEMMGLPAQALSTEYWFPWYNFAAANSMDQGFRVAVP